MKRSSRRIADERERESERKERKRGEGKEKRKEKRKESESGLVVWRLNGSAKLTMIYGVGVPQYTILLTSHYSTDKLHTDHRAFGPDSTLFICGNK